MSCNSFQRDLYFAKHCKDAPDVTSYLDGLRKSPFKQHQRAFKELFPRFQDMLRLEQIKRGMEVSPENT